MPIKGETHMNKIAQKLIILSCLLLLVGCVIPQQRSSGGIYGSPVVVKRDRTYRNQPVSPYDSNTEKRNHKYDRNPNKTQKYDRKPAHKYDRKSPYGRNKNYNPRYKQHGNKPRQKQRHSQKYPRNSHDNDHYYDRDRQPSRRKRYDQEDYPHSHDSHHRKRKHSHDSHHQNNDGTRYNQHNEHNDEEDDYNDRYDRRRYKRKVYKDYGRSLVGQ